MSEIDKKIRKGLPPRRDATCFQTQCDIVIPSGTILRAIGDDKFAAEIGFGAILAPATFSIKIAPSDPTPDAVKRVVAS